MKHSGTEKGKFGKAVARSKRSEKQIKDKFEKIVDEVLEMKEYKLDKDVDDIINKISLSTRKPRSEERTKAMEDFKQGKYDIVYAVPQNNFGISWGAAGIGFGEFFFYKGEGDKLLCDNECMSKDFIRAVLNKLVDDLEITNR